ncbi:MAG TPA: archaeal proteasome endopeptidase complex subunit beta [Ignisphaera sp.]|uniref:Proteasome subunit beta n=1 Tax=Ignisphaera aggregans TaxID=334771 RepID=A0A832YYC0_9CREN|nr:archaeal proteasome endopeptidase complex subunit beta [Ignisphaera sp.]HIP56802.1 archaeal proteasome endopeptidase complex subunit beta [Ignisphaera aggregans]
MYRYITQMYQQALRGTTTVGMVLRDYVILAADKRATSGHYIAHKHVKKIVRIAENAAITTAGLVADAQALADYLRAQSMYHKLSTGLPMSLRSMAYLLSLILNEAKLYPYIVQLLLGGYDYYEGPKLYAIELFGDVTEERYTATGSGSPIAIGIIESEYREDLAVDEAIKLAVRAVVSASLRDAFSGEGVDVAIIGRDYYRELTYSKQDIRQLFGRALP